MRSIFNVNTSGVGKSLLASGIYDYYTRDSAFVGILNLDPQALRTFLIHMMWMSRLIPVSNATGDWMVNLEASLSRILNLGEEVED